MFRSDLLGAWMLVMSPLVAFGGAGPGKANDFDGRRVLILGLDGCRPDVLQKAMTEGMAPHLQRLIAGGTVTWTATAGGELETATQQQTISGPGWTSICTGVWIDRHHVKDNGTPACDEPETPGSYLVSRAPHFARPLKAAFPQCRVSSLCSWAWIEDYLVAAQPEAFDDHAKGAGKNYAEKDEDVKNKAVALLGAENPDVLFLHFDQIDGAGHATGFSPDNVACLLAVRRVDALVEEVQAALAKRPGATEEKWLTIVTTDHGGLGTKHGGSSPEERTIFFAMHGEGIPAGQVLKDRTGHTAVPPTVFAWLGVPVDPAWGWASPSFAVPLRKP